VSADDVLVTSGAQQALDIAVRLTLPEGRRHFRVPDACYPGALELFSSYGGELVGAGSDAHLEYTMPVVENPTGGTLSARARAALLAERHWVLEDDAYAELAFDGIQPAPLLAAARERVLHVGTLSKTLCPGIRIGWLVTPPELRDAARSAKVHADLQGNTFAQSVVERYLGEEDYDARLGMLRTFYAQKAEALMRAVRHHLPHCHFEAPHGGFSLWLTTSGEWDEVELLRAAISCGTSFDPGHDFRRDRARQPLAMRLAFSSVAAGDMDEAVSRLARAFREVSRRGPRGVEGSGVSTNARGEG
jgi:2-aminoadipate transaminase